MILTYKKAENIEYSLNDCTKKKMRLVIDGQDPENIWVAHRDGEKNCFLLNDALNLYPFHSWGSMWKYGSELDLFDFRNLDKPEMVLHIESWDGLIKMKVIDEDGNILPSVDIEDKE